SDPAWSLSYEAWYYAIYASFIFAPVRWRWHAAAVCVLLAGPPIVALMPCWLLGTWLYKRRTSLVLPPTLAYALFAACIALYAAVYTIDLGGQARVWLSDMTGNHSFRLRASTKFATDFLDACLFAGTIVAVGSMPAINRALAAARSAFRAISSKTFSLYLYHMPVFVILYGGLHIGRGSNTGATICIVSVVLVCALLGNVTEAKLAPWRRGVRRMIDLITAGAAASRVV
ncbi:MAG: hypothetical protein M3N26_08265, partial [Pseudomonadota bacterium]|nr:hypothetical protein [Pseudomonadota bacterium]